MNKLNDTILKRTYVLFALMLLFGGVIVVKMARLQFLEKDRWLTEQRHHKVYTKRLAADRGSILAVDGSMMATTVPYFRAAFDATALDEQKFPTLADSITALCNTLALHFGKELEKNAGDFEALILKAQQHKDQHVYLFPYRRLLDYNEMKLIRSMPIFNQGRFSGGLIVEKVHSQRFYPMNNMCRITLGRIDEGNEHGLKGLEYSFDKALHGEDGETMVQRGPQGVEIPLNYIYEASPRDGYDILTTIDLNMQDVTHNALRRAVEAHNAKSGVAILMEVATGDVKAISNYPEVYNYAIATQVEPGSTFKIASAMAAMEDGFIKPEDTVQTGNGSMAFHNHTMKDEKGYGKLTFQQVIEKSSNIGIAKVSRQFYAHQPVKFFDRLESMGVLSRTDFQVRGEPTPFVIRPGHYLWNATTLPWLATGYNVKLTPLQSLTFFNAIANNGVMVRPRLVKEVRNNAGVRQQFDTEIIKEKICSDKTLEAVRSMLEGVVEHGTAYNIRKGACRIAGKTGTAKEVEDGAYRDIYRSSFVGYFPAEKPRYACIVVINEPKSGSYYGAHVAAPVFREIADKVYATMMQENFRTPPEFERLAKSRYPTSRVMNLADAKTFYNTYNISTPDRPPTDFVRVLQRGGHIEMKAFSPRPGRVPSVYGLSAKDALALLENMGLKVRLEGHGKVKRQSLPPGARIKRGASMTLFLS